MSVPKDDPEACGKCFGAGKLSWTDRDGGTCWRCKGTGRRIRRKYVKCAACGTRRLKPVLFSSTIPGREIALHLCGAAAGAPS